MSPVHHPDDDLLLGYATGSAGEGVSLVVATHLALCPGCRDQVRLCEDVGGAWLDSIEPANGPSLPADLRARLRSEAPLEQGRELPPGLANASPPLLPEPLRSLAGGDVDDLRWRFQLPGVREVVLPVRHAGPAVRLVRLSPWLTIPLHSHRGMELTLVLSGGLRDELGSFERGDLSIRDASHRHEQRVLPGEPCVCLVVNADRLVPLTLLGRILARFSDV